MSKIMLSINLVLSSVIVAWVSVAYFEYKKQSSKDSALPSINLTYSPIPPSFTAEQIQFNASYFVNADTIFAPKLFYLSLPPVSELSDNLLQLNLAAATSKITIENQNISLRAIDLFSPTAPRCCQTNEPKHQYSFDEYVYEVTKERHSVRAASLFSLNVLRFESDLCELNRLK